MQKVYITVELTIDENANIDQLLGEIDAALSYENAHVIDIKCEKILNGVFVE